MKALRLFLLVALSGVSSASAAAQAPERSHVERFSSPEQQIQRALQEADEKLAQNPDDAKALAARGLARLRLGQTDAGVADLRRSAQLDPSSAETQTNLAFGLWVQGHPEEALEIARVAVGLNPNIGAAQYYFGRLLLQTGGDIDQAIEHLHKAIELSPDESDIRFELISAYRRKGDTLNAGMQLRVLRASRPPGDPAVTYVEGLLAADLDQLDLAIGKFREALAANPGLITARYDLGLALVQAKRWNEALEVMGALARERPESFQAAYLHALALQNSAGADAAEPEVRRALALEPNSRAAHTLLGIVLSTRGDYAGAVAELEKSTQLDAQDFDAWFYLGRAHYALRDFSGAERALRRASELRPDHFEARFFLATALEPQGKKDAALAEYKKLTEQWPQDARGFVGLGNLYSRYGELDAAIQALQRARELNPKDFETSLALGRTFVGLKKFDEAVTYLREAISLKANSAEAHYQLALALRRLGKNDEAAQEFAEVERLNREFRAPGGMSAPPPPRPPQEPNSR